MSNAAKIINGLVSGGILLAAAALTAPFMAQGVGEFPWPIAFFVLGSGYLIFHGRKLAQWVEEREPTR
jgi:hypothetical protein